ncbi:hypothetical protein EYF80_038127 [Liparis tanakae]|uniref:Uncharacterized protein n=1 Tax=Liparis tanakae TaxID=230148 RepID=A0A4Z2GDL2_9TELE|nr:hypothetical protein EYF80_038127 [Liparis tanakae]
MLVACLGRTPLLFLDFLSSLSNRDDRSRFTFTLNTGGGSEGREEKEKEKKEADVARAETPPLDPLPQPGRDYSETSSDCQAQDYLPETEPLFRPPPPPPPHTDPRLNRGFIVLSVESRDKACRPPLSRDFT